MTTRTPLKSDRGAGGLPFTVMYFLGMLLLFIGERMVLDSPGARLTLGALAAAAILGGVVGRVVRRGKVGSEARAVEMSILLCYLAGAFAVLLYLAQADFVMERLRPHLHEARTAERYQVILSALWPTFWLCAITPLLFVEVSYAPMETSNALELNRIRRSAASGLVLSLTVCFVFALNFVVSEFNKKVDLSYFKTTRPSESSRKMVQNLSEPLKATLFFPGANEVHEQARSYFDELKRDSRLVEVRTVDHAMEPELAKELGVTDNGFVVLSRSKQNQLINLGAKMTRAKSMLRKLDNEFQTAFRKLSQVQRVAYFTVGHEERTQADRDQVPRSSIGDLRSILQRLNYQVKELGINQGLASEVPTDATVVVVPGPRKDFLPAEVETLKKYLRGGGHLLVFLDPEAGLDLASLLGPFGLKYTPVRLANDRSYVKLTGSMGDRYALFTNRFSAHPSVSTLTRNSTQLATVMIGAGFLEEVPPTEGKRPQVQFTLHSMPFTWNDLNNNLIFDPPAEVRKAYELGAVVTMPTDKPAPPPAASGKKTQTPEMRLIVVADSDAISDQVFRNPGNGYLFVDAIKWLGGEEELIGETTSEEDVRVTHTRSEDVKYFYASIFGVPTLVLGAGLFYTTRRRRRS